MRRRISWLDFLTFSNLFISICSYFFTRFCIDSIKFTSTVSTNAYCFFVACAVFFVYTLQRLFTVLYADSIKSERDFWYRKHQNKLIFLLLVAALIVSILFFIFFMPVFFFLLLALFLSMLYYLGPYPLKHVAGIKNFVIGFVWALVCVFIPTQINTAFFVSRNNLLFFLQLFCFISAVSIPFDIRDMDYDKENRIKSLPVVFGMRNSKCVAVFLLMIVVMISLFFPSGFSNPLFLVYASLAGILVVIFSAPMRHPYYFSLLADGCLFLPFLFRFLFS